MKLVECVPNFSEGKNKAIINAIAEAVSGTENTYLLDVDPGRDTNRTVMTFVAEYDFAAEAAFRAIETACRLIDMSKHRGAHARIGATDVCPFVPVSGVTMKDCIELAKKLGKRVGDELDIPVYMYEHAASSEDRKNLANVRSGEYEGLKDKLKDPEWKPDFGPAKFNPRTGALVIGAREFLIAYNVNLNTRDRKIAHDIALSIREAGRAKRGDSGRIVRDASGRAVKVPGTLEAVKAVGWYIEEYRRAQVSINLIDYHRTSPMDAYEEVKKQAEMRGVRVTGSELVGLIPLEAVLQTGKRYLELQGKSAGVPERVLIETAVQSLSLDDLTPFEPGQKIIEYRVARETPLADSSLAQFSDDTSVDSPVPGGGSVAALTAALAAALTSMVANLTAGKKGYEGCDKEMKRIAPLAQELKTRFMSAVDDDARAFDKVMEAMKMPGKSDEEKSARSERIESATKGAVEIPFDVLKACGECVDLIELAASHGNKNSLSDAGVAALCLGAAANGAFMNVLINLKSLQDKRYVDNTLGRASAAADEVSARIQSLSAKITAEIKKGISR